MREIGEVLRDTVTAHDLAKGRVVPSADLHAAMEAFAQTALTAHAVGSPVDRGATAGPLEPRQERLVAAAQALPGSHALFQKAQLALVGIRTVAHQRALRVRVALFDGQGQFDDLVDDVHVLVVVDGDLSATPDAVDMAPEIDIGLDLRRNGEGVRAGDHLALGPVFPRGVALSAVAAAARQAEQGNRQQQER